MTDQMRQYLLFQDLRATVVSQERRAKRERTLERIRRGEASSDEVAGCLEAQAESIARAAEFMDHPGIDGDSDPAGCRCDDLETLAIALAGMEDMGDR